MLLYNENNYALEYCEDDIIYFAVFNRVEDEDIHIFESLYQAVDKLEEVTGEKNLSLKIPIN